MKVEQGQPRKLVGMGSGANCEGPSYLSSWIQGVPKASCLTCFLLPLPGPYYPTYITQILITAIYMRCFLAEPNYGVVQA